MGGGGRFYDPNVHLRGVDRSTSIKLLNYPNDGFRVLGVYTIYPLLGIYNIIIINCKQIKLRGPLTHYTCVTNGSKVSTLSSHVSPSHQARYIELITYPHLRSERLRFR